MSYEIRQENDNYKSVTYAKIAMALSEAEMGQHDIVFISFSNELCTLSDAFLKWLKQEERSVKTNIMMKHDMAFQDVNIDLNLTKSVIDSTIKVKDLNSIMIIGRGIAVFDIKGTIYIHRKEVFVKEASRILRTVMRISELIDIKKAQSLIKKGDLV